MISSEISFSDNIIPVSRREVFSQVSEVGKKKKNFIVNEIITTGAKASDVAIKYKLEPRTVQRWVQKRRNGEELHDSGGRPAYLTAEKKEEIRSSVNQDFYQMRNDDFTALVNSKVKETFSERGLFRSEKTKVSRRTMGRLEDAMEIKTAKAESTTLSRYESEKDVYNAITLAAANLAMKDITNPYLILNCDATQFEVGEKTEKIKVKYINKPDGPFKAKPKKGDNSGMSFFIKYYMVITASGAMGPPIFIIANENMSTNVVDVYPIIGLGITSPNKGYVVFSKSRVPDEAFYRWFIVDYLVDYLNNEIRVPLTDSNNRVAWLQLDGEHAQVEIFKDESIISVLNDNRIEVGKLPAAFTAIGQPCDVGEMFKSAKAKIMGISDADVAWDVNLTELLKKMYVTHKEKYDSNTRGRKMSPIHVRYGINGLMRARTAIQQTSTPQMIRNSFSKTGIFDTDINGPNVSSMIAAIKTTISIEQSDLIHAMMPHFVQLMKQNGEITDEEIFMTGIYKTSDAAVKDKLALNRRRALILTNRGFIQNEEEKRLEIEENQKSKKPRRKKSISTNSNSST